MQRRRSGFRSNKISSGFESFRLYCMLCELPKRPSSRKSWSTFKCEEMDIAATSLGEQDEENLSSMSSQNDQLLPP